MPESRALAASAAPAGPHAAGGGNGLSLMDWAFTLLDLPASFVNDGLGIFVIALLSLLWMLAMVQGYADRIGEVIGLGRAEAG